MREQKRGNFFKILILTLFVSYQSGDLFFLHTHNIEGHLVTHSHPYKSGEHSHNANDLLVIQSLTFLSSLFGDSSCIENLFAYQTAQYAQQPATGFLPDKHYCFSSLRAPPALFHYTYQVN